LAELKLPNLLYKHEKGLFWNNKHKKRYDLRKQYEQADKIGIMQSRSFGFMGDAV
jgi:hypothetical protein